MDLITGLYNHDMDGNPVKEFQLSLITRRYQLTMSSLFILSTNPIPSSPHLGNCRKYSLHCQQLPNSHCE